MTQEARSSETRIGEFDPSLIAPTDQDWALISSYAYITEPPERCDIIGDLAVLDPQLEISIATKEDWNYFFKEADRLRDPMLIGFHKRWIGSMAKVDSEKVRQALLPEELDRQEETLREMLEGKEDVGLFPASFQVDAVNIDFERTKKVFEEVGETAWISEIRYLSWLRRESPAHFFMLLAALSQISSAKTLTLMEKSDWDLALEGLRYYRGHAGSYNISALVAHLAALKKLTPLFERLSRIFQ